MFLVVPLQPHANASTGHKFVTQTPITSIFAIAIEVPDYKNLMIFGINRKNKMASGGHRSYCSSFFKWYVLSISVVTRIDPWTFLFTALPLLST